MNSHSNLSTRIAFAVALLAQLIVCGCTVGPNYKRPDVAVQHTWTHSPSTQASVIDEASPPSDWWASLNDSQLNSLVRRACESNFSVSIARTRIAEARAERGIAASHLFPNLNGGGAYSFDRADGPLFPVVTHDYQFYAAGFDALWEADIFGGVRRSIEAAQDDVQAQRDAERGAVVSVIAEVARSYVELRTTQQRIIITNANIQTQSDTLDLARRLNATGIVSDLDVTRAQAELTQTQSQIPSLETQVKASIHELGVLLGQSPEALVSEIATPGPIPAPPKSVPIGLPAQLLRRRPDVRQVERQLAAATARIGVAEADLFPQLTITGDFGVGAQNVGQVFNWSNRFVSVGPSVRWELLEGGRILANIDAHGAIKDELLDQYKLTILLALQETADSLIAFDNQQRQVDLLIQTVQSNQDSVRIAGEQYAGGTVGYLSLLDTQRSLLRSQDTLVQSQGAVTLNMIALYKAIGGGWEKVEQDQAQRQLARSK
jgi:NodT family efflux transporter outer membrane factor (OMF) lipoprotein